MANLSLLGLGVGAAFAFLRWRFPVIPKVWASLGVVLGLGLIGVHFIPPAALHIYTLAVLAVGGAVAVLEWRIAKMKVTFKNCTVDAEMKSFIQGGSIDDLKIHDSDMKVSQLLRDTKIGNADFRRSKFRQRKPK